MSSGPKSTLLILLACLCLARGGGGGGDQKAGRSSSLSRPKRQLHDRAKDWDSQAEKFARKVAVSFVRWLGRKLWDKFCSGTVLTKHIIVSVAHCVWDFAKNRTTSFSNRESLRVALLSRSSNEKEDLFAIMPGVCDEVQKKGGRGARSYSQAALEVGKILFWNEGAKEFYKMVAADIGTKIVKYTWDKVSTWFKNKFFLKPVKGPEEEECLLTLVTVHNDMTEELKITPQDLPRTPCKREEEMGRLEAMEEGLLMPGAASTSMVQADTQTCELNPMMTRLETKEECNGAKRNLLHLEEDSEKYKVVDELECVAVTRSPKKDKDCRDNVGSGIFRIEGDKKVLTGVVFGLGSDCCSNECSGGKEAMLLTSPLRMERREAIKKALGKDLFSSEFCEKKKENGNGKIPTSRGHSSMRRAEDGHPAADPVCMGLVMAALAMAIADIARRM